MIKKSPFQPTAFAKIKSLGVEGIAQIDSRLTNGESCASVCRWLQVDQKVLTDVAKPTLTKMLERYRSSELREKVLARVAEASKGVKIATIAKRINAMDEMIALVQQQRARVDVLLKVEEGKPMLLKPLTEEMRLLKDMLTQLGSMQLETGFMTRAPKTIKGILAAQNGDAVAFSWTQEQEKVLRELEDVAAAEAE